MLKSCTTAEQLRTHYPIVRGCAVCDKAMALEAQHRKSSNRRRDPDRTGQPPPKVFRDLLHFDHLFSLQDESVHGDRTALVCLDVATGMKDCVPRATKGTLDTKSAMQEFAGRYAVGSVFSDCAPELKKGA